MNHHRSSNGYRGGGRRRRGRRGRKNYRAHYQPQVERPSNATPQEPQQQIRILSKKHSVEDLDSTAAQQPPDQVVSASADPKHSTSISTGSSQETQPPQQPQQPQLPQQQHTSDRIRSPPASYGYQPPSPHRNGARYRTRTRPQPPRQKQSIPLSYSQSQTSYSNQQVKILGKKVDSSLSAPLPVVSTNTVLIQQRSEKNERKMEEPPSPVVLIPPPGDQTVLRQKVKPKAVKILDRHMQFRIEDFNQLLKPQPDFTIIGIVGMEGCGKSTILSRFCAKESKESKASQVFPVQGMECIINCTHKTWGIDAFVTDQRTILLDTQPLESPSVLASIVQRDEHLISTLSSHQNFVDLQSIQMILFLLSVCHVLLVADDWVADIRAWRLLRTAIMLRETANVGEPFLGDSSSKHSGDHQRTVPLPDIVFVYNKLQEDQLTASAYCEMVRNLNKFFETCPFRKNGSVKNPLLSQFLPSDDNVNIFCLPFASLTGKHKDPFEAQCDDFVGQVLSTTKLRSSARISEKDWLQNASRVWSEIGSCRSLMEYNRTLQKLKIYR